MRNINGVITVTSAPAPPARVNFSPSPLGEIDLGDPGSSRNTTVAYCIDDIMLIGGEQEVANTWEALVRYLSSSRWEINPKKIQGATALVKFLGGPITTSVPGRAHPE